MPAVITSLGGHVPEHDGKITFYVILCVIISAFGGLLFGYDIGISGGVTAMDDFLIKFFPAVYEKKKLVHEDNYCKYDNEYLQLFTSSLYIAALVASFVASKVCSKFGRRTTLQIGSFFFVIGVALQASGVNLAMVVLGRIILGFGVGFGNQAVPLFLSELAPARLRGALNICFQLFITIGILIAGIINYFTSNIHPHGWRISLGLAGIPAMILLVGSFAICETPTSLIERNQIDQGKDTLRRIRGTDNISAEFDSIVAASEAARQVKNPFRKLMRPSSRPPLVIAIVLQVFQQFTGINAIMFYAPVLFQTVGFGSNAALLSTVITGLVNVFSTLVSIYTVDKAGRRVLLLEACVQMFITQTVIGMLLLLHLKPTGSLGSTEAMVVVVLVCVYVMGFAWSWGPLGWLIPSETFPLETRTAGFACAVSSNMLCTFIIAQAFLSMLCHMKAGIFFFFAAWILVMGLFTLFLLPETKGVPVDSMAERVWKQHWFWKRYMIDDDENDGDKVVKG
ncbi:sugar transport protein 8-like isoform X1 [Rhodamnia argentea]|uniref:Sugar transport protein 8-like isoform X1 n=2 Tax=Rhodamnia argentea TaxID=178133 RepID=A0ABM3HLJ0_9MYRT|nr:sugar transport protein 8-like isoform X1 [Rhodamnia argentea]